MLIKLLFDLINYRNRFIIFKIQSDFNSCIVIFLPEFINLKNN